MEGRAAAGDFGEDHFGAADLGDRRRNRRLVRVANAVVKHPGGTLPEKVNDPAELKALYRLMNAPKVTHEGVLAPSRERTLRRMGEARGTVLVIHDGTELDYSGLKSVATLGRIGNGGGRGYLAHNVLAVAFETRGVIGLAYQHLARRPTVGRGESRAARRARADRESRCWRDASRAIPPAASGRLQVEVADRGGDVLEFLDFMESRPKSYLVRSRHDRRVVPEGGGEAKLHDLARRLPPAAGKSVEVPASGGLPARAAEVAIGWAKVTLPPPKQPRGETRGVPLTAWVVIAREADPPPGVDPLEWVLLTNVPVGGPGDAAERVSWYECRWVIEEYHKALKTGCGVEALQFTTEAALKPAIALLSVTALFLLALRDASRSPAARDRPAREWVAGECVALLGLWRYKARRDDLTASEFFYALARLGGHQNRKGDPPPAGSSSGAAGRGSNPWSRRPSSSSEEDVGKPKGRAPGLPLGRPFGAANAEMRSRAASDFRGGGRRIDGGGRSNFGGRDVRFRLWWLMAATAVVAALMARYGVTRAAALVVMAVLALAPVAVAPERRRLETSLWVGALHPLTVPLEFGASRLAARCGAGHVFHESLDAGTLPGLVADVFHAASCFSMILIPLSLPAGAALVALRRNRSPVIATLVVPAAWLATYLFLARRGIEVLGWLDY